MLIDWFTVVAQFVNFVILVVALKYLLYDRILAVMEARRQRFLEREEETQRFRDEAAEESERIRAERREIESNWENMIDEARREADERRRELLEQARSQVEERERQWRDTILDHRDRLAAELRRETGERAVEISRRASSDLAGADFEAMIVATFLDRLAASVDDGEVMDALTAEPEEPVTVRTAFPLSDEQRDSIRTALHDLLGDPARELEWVRDPGLIAGIALIVGARRIGWAIDSYLEEVEERFADVLRRGVERVPDPAQLGEAGEPDREEVDAP